MFVSLHFFLFVKTNRGIFYVVLSFIIFYISANSMLCTSV